MIIELNPEASIGPSVILATGNKQDIRLFTEDIALLASDRVPQFDLVSRSYVTKSNVHSFELLTLSKVPKHLHTVDVVEALGLKTITWYGDIEDWTDTHRLLQQLLNNPTSDHIELDSFHGAGDYIVELIAWYLEDFGFVKKPNSSNTS